MSECSSFLIKTTRFVTDVVQRVPSANFTPPLTKPFSPWWMLPTSAIFPEPRFLFSPMTRTKSFSCRFSQDCFHFWRDANLWVHSIHLRQKPFTIPLQSSRRLRKSPLYSSQGMSGQGRSPLPIRKWFGVNGGGLEVTTTSQSKDDCWWGRIFDRTQSPILRR